MGLYTQAWHAGKASWIDATARARLLAHGAAMGGRGRKIFQAPLPAACGAGSFVPPTVIEIAALDELDGEVFGPILHVLRFRRDALAALVAAINGTGYGLTLGVHSRLEETVGRVGALARGGNLYVNRSMVGAVVGVQPFGGEGLSGTGPKAGGPHYLTRFTRAETPAAKPDDAATSGTEVAKALSAPWPAATPLAENMPGPTGESNRLTMTPRAPLICLGPGRATALAQAEAIRKLGGHAVEAPGLAPDALATLQGFSGALWWGDAAAGRPYAQALAKRQGPILPLIAAPDAGHTHLERHLCIDTTASGGNAQLLAAAADA